MLRFGLAVSALALGVATQAAADNFINDNLTVAGNACIGPSCVDNDSDAAPYNGIIIKAPAPKLYFDSDNSAENEWSISASATNGGADNFSVNATRVADGSRTPFLIDGQSPSSSLIIRSDGIGFGTSIPQRELHVVDGTAPALRLEQDGTGGLGNHTWDLQSGDGGFQLVDVGSILSIVPFIVENGASPASLVLDSGGGVGMGTNAPSTALHVQRADGSAGLLVENTAASPSAVREMFAMRNNGGSYFTLDNTEAGKTWFFVHENNAPNRFIIADGVNDGPEMTVAANGNLVIQGQLFTAGSCAAGCDRVFDADYPLPSFSDQMQAIRSNGHLPAVGPTAEDGPFNVTAMTGGMLNELEKAYLYIAQQEARITRLEALVETLAAR